VPTPQPTATPLPGLTHTLILPSVLSGCGYEVDGHMAPATKYYLFNGQRVAMRQAYESTVTYLYHDHLGSTVATSDGESTRYWPYGDVRTGEVDTPYQYTGQRADSSTGLYAMGVRWYDPQLGRWTQPDTIVPEPGNPQDLNRYTYCRNNPTRYIDPAGHDPADWDPDWVQRYTNAHGGTPPAEEDWQDYQFSLSHPGSGPGGSWTSGDWETYISVKQMLGPLMLFIGHPTSGSQGLGEAELQALKVLSVPYLALAIGPDHTVYVFGPAIPPNAGAMTIGEVINLPLNFFAMTPRAQQDLLTHEYVHVLQYRFRSTEFPTRYAREGFAKWPPADQVWNPPSGTNSFEVEATQIQYKFRENPAISPLWTWLGAQPWGGITDVIAAGR